MSPRQFLSKKKSFDYLSDIPFEPAETENIELLIGESHPNLHLYTETKTRNCNDPVAVYTMLDWVLFMRNNTSENYVLNKLQWL